MSDDFEDTFSRACLHATEFRKSLPERPNLPKSDYHALRHSLMQPLPENGTPAALMIDELAEIAEPGLMAMPGPRFFGWVLGGSHPAGVAADWLTSSVISYATNVDDSDRSTESILRAWRSLRDAE